MNSDTHLSEAKSPERGIRVFQASSELPPTPKTGFGETTSPERQASPRLAATPRLKAQAFREVIRENGLAKGAWWAITYGIPRNLLGAHWTKFASGVYLGSQHTRWGRRVLSLCGIRAAVNMREDFDDIAYGIAFPYHLQPALLTPDHAEALRLGLVFIHDLRSRGEKVYIHCSTGIHRAAAMAAAYLVSVGWSLGEAKTYLTRCRRGVAIRPAREPDIQKAVEIFLAGRRNGSSG